MIGEGVEKWVGFGFVGCGECYGVIFVVVDDFGMGKNGGVIFG